MAIYQLDANGSQINTNFGKMEDLYQNSFYEIGEVYSHLYVDSSSIAYGVVDGYVTSNRTGFRLMIPVEKSFSKVNGVILKELKMNVREHATSGGCIGSTASVSGGVDWLDLCPNPRTLAFEKFLRIYLDSGSAVTSSNYYSNNQSYSFQIHSLKFECI